MGASMTWVSVVYVTLVQRRVAPEHVGRVMGLLMFAVYGLYPVSYGLAGLLSEIAGARSLFVVGAGLVAASAGLGLATPTIRRLD
jgi:MFS family permease